MASNPPVPQAPFVPGQRTADTETFVYGGPRTDDGPWEEWNPTADSVRPVRGKHRVSKQRGGGLARSSTVLGVGVIAAVGAGGMASAQSGKPPVAISMPDLPSVSSFLPGEEPVEETPQATSPLSSIGTTTADTTEGTTDAGEALRARIMAQAEQQQDQAEARAVEAAQAAAEKQAAEAAAKAEKEAEAKAAAEKAAAEEEARKKAEAERLAELARQYTLPTSSYTLTSVFGQAGSMWSSGYHTGLDFAAPTGTPLKAVHTGTVTEAGWSGSYGYRTVLTLEDGTEVWYAHQSSINVSVGQQVNTGDVIGRVGATGNVTGPHLHLEVHTGDGDVDPMAWLQSKGLTP
ncbi:M23 family metallopeptidase [Streptomyces sp. NPDC058739]|uniref:M23 family metallopeptidase n=1 Tax=Streptomyces sp. NPDC058739 TaxID=3346618 RepID=UPI0036C33AF1